MIVGRVMGASRIARWCTGIRHFSSGVGDGWKRFEVRGVDKRLLCLDEDFTVQGKASPKVGDALFAKGKEEPIGVLLFYALGMYFGACLENVAFEASKGMEIHLNPDLHLAVAKDIRIDPNEIDAVQSTCWAPKNKEDSFTPVFRHQPRDTEREVITEGWNVGIGAIDALTPLGVGQSMLFTANMTSLAAKKRDTLMIDAAVGALTNQVNPDSHCWIALPPPDACTSGLFTKESLSSRFAALGITDRVTLADSEVYGDEDIYSMINSYSACSLAELRRDRGQDALLLLPDLQSHYSVWRRAQRLAAAHYEEKTEDIPAATFAPGSDRADLRQFYSALIQRSSRLNKTAGGGTLSTFQGVFIGKPASTRHVVRKKTTGKGQQEEGGEEEEVFEARDFFLDTSRSPAEINRIKLLADRGIKLTRTTLKKVGIEPPLKALDVQSKKEEWGLTGPLVTAETQTQHAEELKSISDGHISVVTLEEALFDFDVGNSLTRIGIGINKTKSRDTRAPALRQVAGPLRVELCHMLDVHPDKGEEVPLQALMYSAALRHHAGKTLAIEEEVAILYAIRQGLFDTEDKMKLLNGGPASTLVKEMCGLIPTEIVDKIRAKREYLSEDELAKLLKAVQTVCSK